MLFREIDASRRGGAAAGIGLRDARYGTRSPGAAAPLACRLRDGIPAQNDVPSADRHRADDGCAPSARPRIPIRAPAVAATDDGRRQRARDARPRTDFAHPEEITRNRATGARRRTGDAPAPGEFRKRGDGMVTRPPREPLHW